MPRHIYDGESRIQCLICHDVIPRGGVWYDFLGGYIVCEDCIDSDDVLQCPTCGMVGYEGDMHGDNGECHSCYYTCESCGDVDDNGHFDERDRWVCRTCSESEDSSDNDWRCVECDDTFEDGIDHFVDVHGSWWCTYCWTHNDHPPEASSSHEPATEVIQTVHEYSYTPRLKFMTSGEEPSTELFLGFEVEVDWTQLNRNQRQLALNLCPDWTYLKKDSSVEGFEIVSHPCSLRWLRENIGQWDTLFEGLYNMGVRSGETTTCGLHIHMSKAAFGAFHLYKLLKLFYGNPGLVTVLSQRDYASLSRWANLDVAQRTLIYRAKARDQNGNDRHCAVNLKRTETVEVRVFKGTLNPLAFRKAVETVTAAYEFSKDYPKEHMTEEPFLQYVQQCAKKYPTLSAFLSASEEERTAVFGGDMPQYVPMTMAKGPKLPCV